MRTPTHNERDSQTKYKIISNSTTSFEFINLSLCLRVSCLNYGAINMTNEKTMKINNNSMDNEEVMELDTNSIENIRWEYSGVSRKDIYKAHGIYDKIPCEVLMCKGSAIALEDYCEEHLKIKLGATPQDICELRNIEAKWKDLDMESLDREYPNSREAIRERKVREYGNYPCKASGCNQKVIALEDYCEGHLKTILGATDQDINDLGRIVLKWTEQDYLRAYENHQE